jgi:hypothetical protein
MPSAEREPESLDPPQIAGIQAVTILERREQARKPEADLVVPRPQLPRMHRAQDVETGAAAISGQPEDLPVHPQHDAPGDFPGGRIHYPEHQAIVHPFPGPEVAER